ncbi:MAG: hypothetical protein ACK4HE_07755 [Chitinophagaceae bacterium]
MQAYKQFSWLLLGVLLSFVVVVALSYRRLGYTPEFTAQITYLATLHLIVLMLLVLVIPILNRMKK